MFIHFVYNPILYNIYTYIYIYVAYLYSNYCCIFGILTAFSPGTKLVWMLLSGRQSISMDSFGSYSNCRSLTVDDLFFFAWAWGLHQKNCFAHCMSWLLNNGGETSKTQCCLNSTLLNHSGHFYSIPWKICEQIPHLSFQMTCDMWKMLILHSFVSWSFSKNHK